MKRRKKHDTKVKERKKRRNRIRKMHKEKKKKRFTALFSVAYIEKNTNKGMKYLKKITSTTAKKPNGKFKGTHTHTYIHKRSA